MTTFGLLHGAWHCAWHWHLVAGKLRRLGHEAVAVDLPAAGGALAGADVVVEALAGVDDGVTVVGHSMGGLVAPVVAQRRPVRRVVFVAGLLPMVGQSWNAQVAAAGRGEIMLPGLRDGQMEHGDGSTSWADLDKAISRFYPDAPHALALAAARRLRRQYWAVMTEVSPLVVWPDIEYTSIVCGADRVVNPAWSRRVCRDRLGTVAVELSGDHVPMLSRPAELAAMLVR